MATSRNRKPYRTELSSRLETGEKLTSEEWDEHNKSLFTRRVELTTEANTLEDNPRRGRVQERQLARLRSEIDRITGEIAQTNYGLVRNYVGRFTQVADSDTVADLEASGVLGLMKAIDSYDPAKGKFASWAWKPIQREVLAAVRSADHQNLNSGDFEARANILRAVRAAQADDAEVQLDYETIARESGATLGQVKRVVEAPKLDSVSAPVGDGTSTLGDLIEDQDHSVEDRVLAGLSSSSLATGLEQLDPRERFVLGRRAGLDSEPKERLSELGAVLSLSREAVRQIEMKAMSKLTHPVALHRILRDGRAA